MMMMMDDDDDDDDDDNRLFEFVLRISHKESRSL